MSAKEKKELPSRIDPGSRDFDLFSSPFYLIAHADFKYHEDLDKVIAKFGLDRTTYRLLTVLMRRSPINIKELSQLALQKRSTATRALGRMRRKGWITQSQNTEDSRNIDVELTDEGRALAKKVMRYGSRQLQRAVEGLTEEEIKSLTYILRRLVDNLSKLPIE